MSLFGEKIKYLRELEGLLQRDVAQKLAIDGPMLSKIESGERQAKREQIIVLSKVLKTNESNLLSLWLADRVYKIISDEPSAINALLVVQEFLKNSNKKPI